jgi:hypothetical protein
VTTEFVELRPEYPGMNSDRRGHTRVSLRLPLILISSATSSTIRSETEDVSMHGFFFRSTQMLSPGERLKFMLLLPGVAGALQPVRAMYLKGEVEVVRVTAFAGDSAFGIGCRMSHYRVFMNSDLLTGDELLAALIKEGTRARSNPCSLPFFAA